jgi:hypothetical protein
MGRSCTQGVGRAFGTPVPWALAGAALWASNAIASRNEGVESITHVCKTPVLNGLV